MRYGLIKYVPEITVELYKIPLRQFLMIELRDTMYFGAKCIGDLRRFETGE